MQQQPLPFAEAEGAHAERIGVQVARLLAGPAADRFNTLRLAAATASLAVWTLLKRIYRDSQTGTATAELTLQEIASFGDDLGLRGSRDTVRRAVHEACRAHWLLCQEGRGRSAQNVYQIDWPGILLQLGGSISAAHPPETPLQFAMPPSQIARGGSQIATTPLQIATFSEPSKDPAERSPSHALACVRGLSVCLSCLSTSSDRDGGSGGPMLAVEEVAGLAAEAAAAAYGTVPQAVDARRAFAQAAVLALSVFDRDWLLGAARSVRSVRPRPNTPWRYVIGTIRNQAREVFGYGPFATDHELKTWFGSLMSAAAGHTAEALVRFDAMAERSRVEQEPAPRPDPSDGRYESPKDAEDFRAAMLRGIGRAANLTTDH